MSTKAQAILEEIQGLPPEELRELRQQVNQMAAESEKAASPFARVAEEEFEAALDEVTVARPEATRCNDCWPIEMGLDGVPMSLALPD